MRTTATLETVAASAPGRFQFRLRSLLILVTACSLLAAIWPWQLRDERLFLLLACVGLLAIQAALATWAILAWRNKGCLKRSIAWNEDRWL